MSTFKKTIFLKNDNPTQIFGILTMDKKHEGTFGEFKIYNSTNHEYILGIKSGDKIFKQNVNLISNKCSFKFQKDIDIEDSVSCILFENNLDSLKPIIYGAEKDEQYKTQILSKLSGSMAKIKTNICTPKEEQCEKINTKEEIATAQNTAQLFETDDKELDQIIDNNIDKPPHNFYNMISDQLDELFSKYPPEENLSTLVPNSQWVKIDHEYDNKYYVVGKIFENNDIKYICYGVPGSYNSEQPKELQGYSQWLPTDITDPYNSGYWVLYQDADTGENIKINT